MEVLGREIEVAGAELLHHPLDLVHAGPPARSPPAPPVHDPLRAPLLIGVAQPAKVPFAHPQQLRRLHAAQLPRLMQPNRIDDPGHSDLRQHAIPPVKTRTDRVLQNPDISRVTATTPGQPSAKWRMKARKQAWNCSGSSNRNTRENVSWLGMPCSRGRNWRRNR